MTHDSAYYADLQKEIFRRHDLLCAGYRGPGRTLVDEFERHLKYAKMDDEQVSDAVRSLGHSMLSGAINSPLSQYALHAALLNSPKVFANFFFVICLQNLVGEGRHDQVLGLLVANLLRARDPMNMVMALNAITGVFAQSMDKQVAIDIKVVEYLRDLLRGVLSTAESPPVRLNAAQALLFICPQDAQVVDEIMTNPFSKLLHSEELGWHDKYANFLQTAKKGIQYE